MLILLAIVVGVAGSVLGQPCPPEPTPYSDSGAMISVCSSQSDEYSTCTASRIIYEVRESVVDGVDVADFSVRPHVADRFGIRGDGVSRVGNLLLIEPSQSLGDPSISFLGLEDSFRSSIERVGFDFGLRLPGLEPEESGDFDCSAATPSIPGDPNFGDQWALHNVGQCGGQPDVDINAVEAWVSNPLAGKAPVVIVADTGIDHWDEELRESTLVESRESFDDKDNSPENGFIDDKFGADVVQDTCVSGAPARTRTPCVANTSPHCLERACTGRASVPHGTSVAAIIAAEHDNDRLLRGVAPGAKIVPCRLGPNYPQGVTAVSRLYMCLEYALALKRSGLDVAAFNFSHGTLVDGESGCVQPKVRELLERKISELRDEGILVVVSAGNDGCDLSLPSASCSEQFPAGFFFENVLVVAASTPADTVWKDSNFGRRAVHLSAPGVHIRRLGVDGILHRDSGASWAAAHVSGAAALVYGSLAEQIPVKRRWISVRNLLVSGGTPIADAPRPTVSGRRLRLIDDDGTGALSCSEQRVRGWLMPRVESVRVPPGTNIRFVVVNIECDKPGADTFELETGNETISMKDDGKEFGDGVEGDGYFFGCHRFFASAEVSLPASWQVPDKVKIDVAEGASVSGDEQWLCD